MATIVLQAVGSAIGSFVGGPIGAVVGRTLGAIGGSYIDNQLFGPGDQSVVGPRLENTQILSSREGSAIPRVFGRARISGEIIWATNFKEVQQVEVQSQGGKGGQPKSTIHSFSYFGNFAIGLCEGEIAASARIWADGKLLDQSEYTIRTHSGSADQQPDSLIEAIQGTGNAPAYRGLAYLVFEDFPLEDFGNRIPQISVEIIVPVGSLEKHVHAVNIIPGATEFGYNTEPVIDSIDGLESVRLNVHQSVSETDFIASLNELKAICPNLKQVALVVAWFGDDLRVGECTIGPRVEVASRNITSGADWSVAGLTRQNAQIVSYRDGQPAYGGTPSDNSVLRAIAAIKSVGLRVCFNPFLLMDIDQDNQLPDPHGGSEQGAYPWRGLVTCYPGPDQAGTADQSNLVESQLASFVGSIAPLDIQGIGSVGQGQLEFSYRRMILHYAKLADEAGGVDMFLIGSEMIGLTRLRNAADEFPFVDALVDIAADVREFLDPECLVTYGADWSEYFGLHPQDGSQDVYFNLDKLWSSEAISAIGIDNYMPLSDWRSHNQPEGSGRSSSDVEILKRNVSGGEGYHWYYASPHDRINGTRTSITDGQNDPWIFRYKDLIGWWSHQHFDRRGGVELSTPTNWIPQSKPIVFTEFGCAAIDNGANQTNVFVDGKSSQSALPYFSDGGRDDKIQAAYIEAHQAHWDESHPDFLEQNNPVSTLYGGRMVDFQSSQLWAWDARPYPYFPHLSEVWADGENWRTGHWLNGRLGNARLGDIIAEFLQSVGIDQFDVTQVSGSLDGYIVSDQSSGRQAIEALLNVFQIDVFEDAGTIFFRSPGYESVTTIAVEELDHALNEPVITIFQEQENDLPVSVHMRHLDPDIQYQETETEVSRVDRTGKRQQNISIPAICDQGRMEAVSEDWMRNRWTQRESLSMSLSMMHADLNVGDLVSLKEDPTHRVWKISKVETGSGMSISAKSHEQGELRSSLSHSVSRRLQTLSNSGPPQVVFMDLPTFEVGGLIGGNSVAALTVPWVGEIALYSSATDTGYSFRQSLDNAAFLGELVDELPGSAVTSRWAGEFNPKIRLSNGTLFSVDDVQVLNGTNGLAVQKPNGQWEVLQFSQAQLVANKTWSIGPLLRGQAGTEYEAGLNAPVGARVVLLNSAVNALVHNKSERGLTTNWLAGPAGKTLGGASFSKATYTPGYRSLLPLSPVHLEATELDQFLNATWVRRGRIGADDWQIIDIPIGEDREEYSVRIFSNETEIYSSNVTHPSVSIPLSDLSGSPLVSGQTIEFRVAQISGTIGEGPTAIHFLKLN